MRRTSHPWHVRLQAFSTVDNTASQRHAPGRFCSQTLMNLKFVLQAMKRVTIFRMVLSTTLTVPLGGCTGTRQGLNDWFEGSAQSSISESSQVYYSAVQNLAVHSDSSGNSAILGRLALHEKVSRTRIEHGYAYVSAPQSKLEGWVDNAKLIWRLPPQHADSEPGTPPGTPAPRADSPQAEKTAPPAQPTPEPTASPSAYPSPLPAVPEDAGAKPSNTQREIPKMFNPF